MEKKLKVIILIAIIAGTGLFIGVTAGIILNQQGAIDQILLLLGIILPKKTINNAPTSNHPEDITTAPGGSETINWTLYDDDVKPGQYRVWVNDSNNNYYISVNWTIWSNNTHLAISINRTGISLGIVFNYTIEFYDNKSKFGTPDTVMVTQKMWTWMSGNNTIMHKGIYGTKGIPATGNIPGTRQDSVSWMDSDDNLWLFGGWGRDSTGNLGNLNDLWMFNTTSGWWTWVNGSSIRNQVGTYGTKGVPAAENVPGARQKSISWIDSDDNLWLFGGNGFGNLSQGLLNDLWMFNMTSKLWMWMSGNYTHNQLGIYGTKGLPAAENVPGGREWSTSWIDSNDDLWLFGGNGYDSTGSWGQLNDLWMYKISSGWWNWVSGNDTRNQNGTYGTKGVPAAENAPGARERSISWIDSNYNLWLFGGYGHDIIGGTGNLNDLWMFNMTSRWWMWVSGSILYGQAGIYGTKGVSVMENIPGARFGSVSWIDGDDNLWLFGGFGRAISISNGLLNDLWMLNMTTGWWIWVSGNDVINQAGIYGTKGVLAADNIPGARRDSVSWIDANYNLWLFGGWGYDSNGDQSNLNDLWKYGR